MLQSEDTNTKGRVRKSNAKGVQESKRPIFDGEDKKVEET